MTPTPTPETPTANPSRFSPTHHIDGELIEVYNTTATDALVYFKRSGGSTASLGRSAFNEQARPVCSLIELAELAHDVTDWCGCWLDEADNVHRHAFRFLKGDRVQWGKFGGITGTVEQCSAGGARPFVKWDAWCKDFAPTAFPDIWAIRHAEVKP